MPCNDSEKLIPFIALSKVGMWNFKSGASIFEKTKWCDEAKCMLSLFSAKALCFPLSWYQDPLKRAFLSFWKPLSGLGQFWRFSDKVPIIWLWGHCTHLPSVAGVTCQLGQGSCRVSCTPTGRLHLESGFSVFCVCRGHPQRHSAKSRCPNENANDREAVGNGSRWAACQNVLLGRACCEGAGEPNSLVCRVAFLGDSCWVAHGQVWRKHIFIDVPIVTGSYSRYLNNSCRFWQLFLFPIYIRLFYFGKIFEDQWSGAPGKRIRVKAGLGVASTEPLKGAGPGKGAKNICHGDARAAVLG